MEAHSFPERVSEYPLSSAAWADEVRKGSGLVLAVEARDAMGSMLLGLPAH
jgi:hypothetical protein